MTTTYKTEFGDIQVLSTMQAIRKRPTMYVGKLNEPKVLTNLVIEAMCLSRAIVAAGHATEIEIKVSNNTILVYNNGPGISMEKGKDNLSMIERLLTQLYACRNIKHEDVQAFCDNGIVVVNALSEYLAVLNVFDGVAYHIHYAKGALEDGPFVVGAAKRNGLAIEFKPDAEIFGDLKIDKGDLIAVIEEIKTTTPAKITLEFDN